MRRPSHAVSRERAKPAKGLSHADPFRARSDTLDADGRIEVQASPRVPSSDEIQQAVLPLSGMVSQTPPAYSAKKIQGKRAYELARAGQTPEMTPRPRANRPDRRARLHGPHLELEFDCGGGTYIRSIARDIGEALGCGGLVEALSRTRIGPFTLEQAVDQAALSAESIDGQLRPAAGCGSSLAAAGPRCRSSRGGRPGEAACDTRSAGRMGPREGPVGAGRFRGEADCPGRARSRSRLDSTSQGLGVNLRCEYLEPGARLPCPIRARACSLKMGMRIYSSLTRI